MFNLLKKISVLFLIALLALSICGCEEQQLPDNSEAVSDEGESTDTDVTEQYWDLDALYLKGKSDDIHFFIYEGGPVQMSAADESVSFEGLTDGDAIRVSVYTIEETYPGHAKVYAIEKISDGQPTDIDKDTLGTLYEMGWLSDDYANLDYTSQIDQEPVVPSYTIVRNQGGLDFRTVSVRKGHYIYQWDFPGEYLLLLSYDYLRDEDGDFTRDEKGFPVSACNMILYLFDPEKGEILSQCEIEDKYVPSQLSYTREGCIIYNSDYDDETQTYTTTCAFEVSFNDGVLSAVPVEKEPYPNIERYLVSPDGRYEVIKQIDDGIGHGGIYIIDEDGEKTQIFKNVMLDDKLDGGKTADLGDVTAYHPRCFVDDTHFIYTSTGWEWTWGFGVYDIETGEATQISDKSLMHMQDGYFYSWGIHSYELERIYRISFEGEEELIASIYEEDGVFTLPNQVHDYSLTSLGSMYIVYDFSEVNKQRYDGMPTDEIYALPIYATLYSLDFSEVLAELEMTYGNMETGRFIASGNTLTMLLGE